MLTTQTYSNDPFFNQAYEEFILDNFTYKDVFYTWQNTPSVTFPHGNPLNCKNIVSSLSQKEVPILPRLSAGKELYCDMGCINYTYITDNSANYDPSTLVTQIMASLETFGLAPKNDSDLNIFIDDFLICKNTIHQSDRRILIHGNLYFDSGLEQVAVVQQEQNYKIANIRPYLNSDMTTHEFNYHMLKTMLPEDYRYLDISPEERQEVWRLAQNSYIK